MAFCYQDLGAPLSSKRHANFTAFAQVGRRLRAKCSYGRAYYTTKHPSTDEKRGGPSRPG